MNVLQVIGVIETPRVRTQLDRIHVLVLMVTLEMESTAEMSMNVHSTVMTVMPTQNVQTRQDHLLASVTITLTTMAMEKRATLTEAWKTQVS